MPPVIDNPLRQLVAAGAEESGALGASLWKTDTTGHNHVLFNTGPGKDLSGLTLTRGTGIVGAAVESGEIIVNAEAGSDSRHFGAVRSISGIVVREMATIPIPDHPCVLQLVNTVSNEPFRGSEIRRAERLAMEIARFLDRDEIRLLRTFVPKPARDGELLASDFRVRNSDGVIMVADLIGSHKLVEAAEGEGSSVARMFHSRLSPLASVVHRLDGWVVSYLGDGLLACFEAATSHIAAAHAFRAAQAMLKHDRQVRVALASGPFEVSALGPEAERRICVDGSTVYSAFDLVKFGERKAGIILDEATRNLL